MKHVGLAKDVHHGTDEHHIDFQMNESVKQKKGILPLLSQKMSEEDFHLWLNFFRLWVNDSFPEDSISFCYKLFKGVVQFHLNQNIQAMQYCTTQKVLDTWTTLIQGEIHQVHGDGGDSKV